MQITIDTEKGLCIYLTGLSGSGKTTIAKLLEHRLNINKYNKRMITVLDGDEVREEISKELGFDTKSRSINVRRIGYVAKNIVFNDGIVICSNIAPYKQDRLHNRKIIQSINKNYIEIYLKIDINQCYIRDPKGFYKINNKGIINSSNEYEIPDDNEITIDTVKYSKNQSVDIIYNYLIQNNYL